MAAKSAELLTVVLRTVDLNRPSWQATKTPLWKVVNAMSRYAYCSQGLEVRILPGAAWAVRSRETVTSAVAG